MPQLSRRPSVAAAATNPLASVLIPPFLSRVPNQLPVLEKSHRLRHVPLQHVSNSLSRISVLLLRVACRLRGALRIPMREACKKHCEDLFKKEFVISKLSAHYHRGKNLKEHLSPNACEVPSLNERISDCFMSFQECNL